MKEKSHNSCCFFTIWNGWLDDWEWGTFSYDDLPLGDTFPCLFLLRMPAWCCLMVQLWKTRHQGKEKPMTSATMCVCGYLILAHIEVYVQRSLRKAVNKTLAKCEANCCEDLHGPTESWWARQALNFEHEWDGFNYTHSCWSRSCRFLCFLCQVFQS